MSPYYPSSPEPVTLNAGVWKAVGQPNRTVTVSFDPRLLAFFVNLAAKRSSRTYQVNNGRPPATIHLD